MRLATLNAATLAVLLFGTAALAGDERPGRYTMTPIDGGTLKLDTATGATSFCARTDGDWVCKPTRDGEQLMRKEMDGLRAEIVALKDQLTKLEEIAGIGDPSRPDGVRPQAKMDLPTEKDVDQAFDYFERMVKKLRERFDKLERETKPGTTL